MYIDESGDVVVDAFSGLSIVVDLEVEGDVDAVGCSGAGTFEVILTGLADSFRKKRASTGKRKNDSNSCCGLACRQQ